MRIFDLLIGDEVVKDNPKTAIESPFDGRTVGEVVFGEKKDIELAVQSACDSFATISHMPSYERSLLLKKIAEGIANRFDELAEIICAEAGKPIRLARTEVERAVSTFTVATEEAKRIGSDLLPLDSSPSGVGRTALLQRFPIGPILAITPFNFPLNLVAHKVAPAIASGNSILVKPSSKAPMASLALAQITREAGVPPSMLNVIPCSNELAQTMVSDSRLKMLTFTGSATVGWALKNRAGKKRVTLELGGNAAAIVEPDTDLEAAIPTLASSAFAYAGQVCISLQRIFVHDSIKAHFIDSFVDYVKKNVVCGNPADPDVLCGPIIDIANADRIERWIDEARRNGGTILCGGTRESNFIRPTVLTDIVPNLPIACQEAFGPVVVIDTYGSFDEAIAKVNNSDYGLQAGVFTSDSGKIMKAFRELEVGAVIHNDAPTFRVDSMPYGGTKDSGIGREGLRYAIEEMTEPRLLVLRE